MNEVNVIGVIGKELLGKFIETNYQLRCLSVSLNPNKI
jgi:hypothetical protein